MTTTARIGTHSVGDGAPPLLVAGPCVIESADATIDLAQKIASLGAVSDFTFVFKASYRKDNRSSGESYRGPGIDEGLEILRRVREDVGCMVTSDVHSVSDVAAAAEVLDIIQIPAFLCRQTSLLEAAAASGRPVNVKKGQFMAPEDMAHVAQKLRASGTKAILLTERGTSFGYHDLVVDFRGLARMRALGCPVVFDATHSLQRPGGLGAASGGEPALVAHMARAAAAVPCDGFFIETHPDPSRALSDAASQLPFAQFENVVDHIARISTLARELTNEKNG